MKKITIITVVYNDLDGIRKTMDSVFSQTYPNVQYVVVDGGSNDGTYDEIRKHLNKIDKVLHERDEGVYDAMNKAIDMSEGEYVIFMNSSDSFYATNTVELAVNLIGEEQKEAYYGDHILLSESGIQRYIKTPQTLGDLWKKMPICHQTLFVKLSWHKKNLFDINNIASDYEVVCKLHKDDKIKKLDLPIAIYLEGGISEKSILISTWERFKLAKKFRLHSQFFVFFYYSILMMYLFSKFKILRILKRK